MGITSNLTNVCWTDPSFITIFVILTLCVIYIGWNSTDYIDDIYNPKWFAMTLKILRPIISIIDFFFFCLPLISCVAFFIPVGLFIYCIIHVIMNPSYPSEEWFGLIYGLAIILWGLIKMTIHHILKTYYNNLNL